MDHQWTKNVDHKRRRRQLVCLALSMHLVAKRESRVPTLFFPLATNWSTKKKTVTGKEHLFFFV